MELHPRVGFNVVGQMPALRDVAATVLYHHERFDGRGYPNGLPGQSIPRTARALAVLEAYDAMTSERPYRETMSSGGCLRRARRRSRRPVRPGGGAAVRRAGPPAGGEPLRADERDGRRRAAAGRLRPARHLRRTADRGLDRRADAARQQKGPGAGHALADVRRRIGRPASDPARGSPASQRGARPRCRRPPDPARRAQRPASRGPLRRPGVSGERAADRDPRGTPRRAQLRATRSCWSRASSSQVRPSGSR